MIVKDFVSIVPDIMDDLLEDMREAKLVFDDGSLKKNAVLFAAEPRRVVKTAPDPIDPRAAVGLAPQARRLTLIADPLRRSSGFLTMQRMLESLRDPTLDPETQAAYTEYQLQEDSRVLLDFRGADGRRRPIIERSGTATTPQPCCQDAAPPVRR